MNSIIREKALGTYGLLLTQYQRRSRAAIGVAFAIPIILTLVPRAYRDYKIFMSYGPGGVPYNVFGWLFAAVLFLPLTSNTRDTKIYDDSEDTRTWLHVEGLRDRGERPIIGPHAVPQRQLSQLPDEDIKKKLIAAFDEIYHKNTDILKMSQSVHEMHTDALFLSDNLPPTRITKQLRGEISHIHGQSGDHSLHVVLSPIDCKKVIEANWGERHPLDGSKFIERFIKDASLPNQYVLVYAPRSEEELEVVMRIVRASIAYMTGSDDVR